MENQPDYQRAKSYRLKLRSVDLPDDVKGNLYLHSMPGRFEPYEAAVAAIQRKGIGEVVCLAPLEEIEAKSPEYAEAVEDEDTPWQQVMFPIVDFGVPSDRAAFLALAKSIAASLRSGTNVLLHCAAGVGRTGTVAPAVLIALGLPLDEAVRRVEATGSHAERPEQVELIEWVAQQLGSGG